MPGGSGAAPGAAEGADVVVHAQQPWRSESEQMEEDLPASSQACSSPALPGGLVPLEAEAEASSQSRSTTSAQERRITMVTAQSLESKRSASG